MKLTKYVLWFLAVFTLVGVSPASLANEFAVFKVNVERLSRYKSSERARAQKAFEIIEAVVNSNEFKSRVLNFTWKNPKNGRQETNFHMSDGLNNAQVLDKILKGAELAYKNEDNHTMDLNLRMYWAPFSRVIGYTTPNSDTINNNRKFFRRMSNQELAGHYFHEWLHKVGFDHEFNWTPERPYSVPYAVGDIVSEIAADL